MGKAIRGDLPPKRLLATGGSRPAERRVARPVLYQFVGSFNSGKATLAAQISSRRDFDIRYTLHLRDNYTIEYARLNPDTMAVPTMVIDDRICTDSFDMIEYLMEHYPGPGDQAVCAAGQTAELLEFVDFARQWDEYMFTYGHMGEKNSDTANGIRLVYLRRSLYRVLDEQPDDWEFLVDAFVNKIAGINVMMRAQQEGPQKEADLAANIAYLHRVLARGSELVAQHGESFLFGDKLSTADVYFLPIFRIFYISMPSFFAEVWERHPNLRGYWERALANRDVQSGLMHYGRKPRMIWALLRKGAPLMLIGWKLGLLKAPTLPEDMERRVDTATAELWQQLRG